MKIRVLKLGEAATEITLPEGSNVQQAMDLLAEKNDWRWNGYTIMVNGSIAVGWTPLKDGDVLTMSPKVEGGAKVKILKLGESAQQVDVPEGSTLAEALVAANLNTAGYSIMKNGTPANTITPISEGDVITLSPKIEGGI
ncbi:MAG: MoaD/ThiS family protein [Nitrospirota bacterium]